MRILFKRAIAIWFLGLGVVCLIAPFRFYHHELRTRDVVRFELIGIIDDPASRATGLLAGAVAVAAESLARFPALHRAVEERLPFESAAPEDRTAPSDSMAATITRRTAARIERVVGSFLRLPSDEAEGFLAAAAPADWGDFRLIYKRHLFDLQSFEAGFLQQIADIETLASAGPAAVSVSFRLSGPTPLLTPGVAPELSPEAVASWRPGREALEVDRPSWSYRDGSPTLEREWNERLTSAGLAPLEDNQFVYRGRLFEAEPRAEGYTERVPHPSLPVAMRILGLVALFLGLLAGRGLYASSEAWGTRTSRTGPLVAADSVVLLFAALSFVPCLDFLLTKAFGTVVLAADEPLLTVTGAGLLVLAVPLCSFFVTAQGLQRVEVDADGVEVRGLAGRERVAWTEVRAIEVREIPLPVLRAGILTMRSLTRTLAMETDIATLTIQEPPFKEGKHRLLDRFDEHAPEELGEQIATARREWTSSW